PPYDHVILDEAHTIEDVAAEHFGISVSEPAIAHLLGTLFHTRHRKGFLTTLSLKDPADVAMVEKTIEQVHRTQTAADAMFENLMEWQRTAGRTNGRVD